MTLWQILLRASGGGRPDTVGHGGAVWFAGELLEALEPFLDPAHVPAARVEAERARKATGWLPKPIRVRKSS